MKRSRYVNCAYSSSQIEGIKSEKRKRKRHMKINIINSDIDGLQEDLYAIMDGYNKIREHLSKSVVQSNSVYKEGRYDE